MSGPNAFPPGGVRALLRTDHVTEPTRQALQARLDRAYGAPCFFSAHEAETMRAMCDRLVPQRAVDIVGALDERLADGTRDGWRYDALPPDDEAYRRGLAGIDETSWALFGAPFVALAGDRSDEVLRAVQLGIAQGPAWETLPAARWFEEVLGEVTEIYFAHPLAQESIDYLGMADGRGWEAVGLNGREPGPAAALHG